MGMASPALSTVGWQRWPRESGTDLISHIGACLLVGWSGTKGKFLEQRVREVPSDLGSAPQRCPSLPLNLPVSPPLSPTNLDHGSR